MVISEATYRAIIGRVGKDMAEEWTQAHKGLVETLADKVREGYHGTLYESTDEYDAWMLWEALTSMGCQVWIARGYSGKTGDMTRAMEVIS